MGSSVPAFWWLLGKALEGWDDQRTYFSLHRLNLNKSKLLTRAAKGFFSKSLTKASEPVPGSQSSDYLPLVSSRTQSPSHPAQPRPCLPVVAQKELSSLSSYPKIPTKEEGWGVLAWGVGISQCQCQETALHSAILPLHFHRTFARS